MQNMCKKMLKDPQPPLKELFGNNHFGQLCYTSNLLTSIVSQVSSLQVL
jgi:hypothetical protein